MTDTPAALLWGQGERGAWGGKLRHREPCALALRLRPLPLGGSVNNVATGKINCGQAAGLRGSLWEQRER